jgi:hypothetical protein
VIAVPGIGLEALGLEEIDFKISTETDYRPYHIRHWMDSRSHLCIDIYLCRARQLTNVGMRLAVVPWNLAPFKKYRPTDLRV